MKSAHANTTTCKCRPNRTRIKPPPPARPPARLRHRVPHPFRPLPAQARRYPRATPGTAAPGAPAAPAVPDYAQRGEEILKGANGKPSPESAVHHAAPIKVPSLAQGVKAKSISDYLKAAEASMKDGKFTSAFDDYDKAEQVAPNNPLIKLGRANAELGDSYYARAEAHLPRCLHASPRACSSPSMT